MFTGMNVEHALHCYGDLRFDALLGDELEEADKRALLEHLACCPRCRERLSVLSRDRARFLSSELATPPWLATAASDAPSAHVPWWTVVAGLALAACALLIPWPSKAPSERAKGGDHLSFFVKRGERVLRGSVERPLQPGDQLRFTYTVERPRYVAILSMDASQHASVYFPSGDRAQRVEAGRDVPLPSAVELDETLGAERIYGVFCDTPIALTTLRSALEQARQVPRLAAGCATDLLLVHKESPTR